MFLVHRLLYFASCVVCVGFVLFVLLRVSVCCLLFLLGWFGRCFFVLVCCLLFTVLFGFVYVLVLDLVWLIGLLPLGLVV